MSDEPASDASSRPSADRLAVRGPDELSAQIQLAARWSEMYASAGSSADQAPEVLRRYRMVHDYIDAVTHGIEPPTPPR